MAGYQYLNREEVRRLRDWHTGLNDKGGHGDRARLRRAVEPMDVVPTPTFVRFLQAMPECWQNNGDIPLEDAALVATLVAHVKTDKPSAPPKSFAHYLATSREGSSKPAMSELRFSQLQKSRDLTDFYRRLVRALALLKGDVDIAALANDLLHWQRERRTTPTRRVQDRLAVRWASDYYAGLTE
ncbi:type I-E CRISPR-associated protein Cse2/CasB [uncultured Microbulbifer sp.]|uniref:type I-E CRISPR-associated protein Cse2/CasB n=1 Tax=uncultured Microbulbifer sp. TaxID=348147 RepID=UPI002616AC9B|nr:type I-E CRISPR-associated protein Cse2/CasB [uncultured Microbulbifer sp.]